VTGLTLAFRRWQASARSLGDATEDDYALVADALAGFDDGDATDRTEGSPRPPPTPSIDGPAP
jgi:hypothetical protein